MNNKVKVKLNVLDCFAFYMYSTFVWVDKFTYTRLCCLNFPRCSNVHILIAGLLFSRSLGHFANAQCSHWKRHRYFVFFSLFFRLTSTVATVQCGKFRCDPMFRHSRCRRFYITFASLTLTLNLFLPSVFVCVCI